MYVYFSVLSRTFFFSRFFAFSPALLCVVPIDDNIMFSSIVPTGENAIKSSKSCSRYYISGTNLVQFVSPIRKLSAWRNCIRSLWRIAYAVPAICLRKHEMLLYTHTMQSMGTLTLTATAKTAAAASMMMMIVLAIHATNNE